jgi:PEP-CTERM motif
MPNRNAIFDTIIVNGNLDFTNLTQLNLDFAGAGSNVLWSDGFWNTIKLGKSGWLIYDVSGSTFKPGNLTLNTTNWADGGGNSFNTVRNGSTFSLSQQGSDVYLNYSVAAVPEPSSALLLGCGAAGFAFYRRRQKRLAVAKQ